MAKKVVQMPGPVPGLYEFGGRWQRTPWRIEAQFLPASVEDLERLRLRIIVAGHSDAVANGLIGWLVAKSAGHHGGSSTAARYRRILEEISESDSPVRSAVA